MTLSLVLAAVCLTAAVFSGCSRSVEREFFAMDTYMRIRIYGGSEEAADDVRAEIERLSALLSATDERSEIYALNHSGGSAVTLSHDSFEVLKRGLDISNEFGDVFELTLRPISRAWGFTEDENRVPSDAELKHLLELADDSRLILDERSNTARLPDGFEVDTGAVAKGYAADIAKALLTEKGVEAALIDLGSSTILAYGNKPDGSRWKIAVKDPKGGSEPAGLIEFDGGAISTSGGYERYFEGPDGQIYWHIIDPRTGAPARTGALSVTVLTDEAFFGDALSTALFVMGPEGAAEYYEAHGGFEYLMFLEDGGVIISPGMERLFTLSE